MELVPSVSRSSGLEDGGDALKGSKLQEDYRNFIEDKIQQYWIQYSLAGHLSTTMSEEQRNAQTNILILLRKLREGLLASKRIDDFAVEVYETSLHLSILFRSPMQITSIVAQLLPQGYGRDGLYHAYSTAINSQTTGSSPTPLSEAFAEISLQSSRRGSTRQIYRPPHARRGQCPSSSSSPHASPVTDQPILGCKPSVSRMPSARLFTALLSLLHTLLQVYPSQSSYHTQLEYYQHLQFNGGDDASLTPQHYCKWLKSLSAALVSRNYARFESLTGSPEVEGVYQLEHSSTSRSDSPQAEVRYFAFKCLIADLRAKVRQTVWTILRAAYRELDINESADWLVRCLMIAPGVHSSFGNASNVEKWLGDRGTTEVQRKQGLEGRWILYRASY